MKSEVFYAKSSEEAIEQLLKNSKVDKTTISVNIKENPSKGFLGFGAKNGVYEISYDLIQEVSPLNEKEEDNIENMQSEKSDIEFIEDINITKQITQEDEVRIADDFIKNLLKNADVDANVESKLEDNLIKIHITGKEASCLIGRRGETLDSIQFLTGLALNKINNNSNTRVYIDIENYRSKREESLKRYCYKAAREVARTRKTKKLDYMNPYERRIIHSALQNDRYVITYSEGTDPYRRVVIEYKK